MSDAWKSYRGAPEPGIEVCAVADIPDGDTLCLELEGYPILLVRRHDEVKAYVNACPHQYLPLDHKGDRLISADKSTLRCTNHSAGFSVETGEGIEGLGIGERLDPIPVQEVHGKIVIGMAT